MPNSLSAYAESAARGSSSRVTEVLRAVQIFVSFRKKKVGEQRRRKLLLPADVLADHVGECAFGAIAEFRVAGGFFTDHETPAPVASIEPFAGGCSCAAGAIEANPRSHLDKRSALWKLGRFFILHPNQGHTLVAFQHMDGADRDFVPLAGLADGSPIAGGEHHHADQQHGSEYNRGKNKKGFFHTGFV